jgi:phosphoribosylcarboxyaminoimidazole (NCAIR) mutase
MSDKMRIGVIIRNQSYLNQCVDGLNFLQKEQSQAKLAVESIKIGNANSSLYDLLKVVDEFSSTVDVLIVASGLANHLPGLIDGYLHYDMQNDQLCVIGVAFSDEERDRYGQFASRNIVIIPDTRLISSGLEEFPFI